MKRSENKELPSQQPNGTLGTFSGVFTPSVLTILGIILFLRLGYVVGQGGLWQALVIIVLANGISVLTTISLSAVATNLNVKGGGDYYLISRTLGLEFGGAIGLVLFLAQSVSIGFYAIGFGEVVSEMIPVSKAYLPQIIASAAVMLLFVLAWLGADWATRFQYVVMAVLAAALISFFAGGVLKWNTALVVENWKASSNGPGFWLLFAIFFPAVTGFTQGVSMSGDLKDPGKSLPLGTFSAVGLSMLIYLLVSLMMAATLPQKTLSSDYGAMRQIAALDFLIIAGVIAATLSSAMASFLGAPRILQSLAGDRIFPVLNPFAAGVGTSNNPRRGTLMSLGIAIGTIAMGNLNLIAPIVSMFFLVSYGLLNYATFFEARSGSPSFRPRFRFYDFRASLVGGVACLGVMLAVNMAASLIAVALLAAIYQYLKRTAGPSRWADSQRSYHLQQVRQHLFAAGRETEHPRNWCPQMLLFADDTGHHKAIFQFASWIQGKNGITTAVCMLEGEGAGMYKRREAALSELEKEINTAEVEIFPRVVSTPNMEVGMHALIQSFGIGPVRPNTILTNWIESLPRFESDETAKELGQYMRMAFRQGCNIIIFNKKEMHWADLGELPIASRRIDVWWWGDASSRLMLLFAYLLTRNPEWQDARIRVLDAGYDKNSPKTVADLDSTLSEVRINAEPEVVAVSDINTVAAYSADAALVFFPFSLKKFTPLDPFGNPLDFIFSRLETAVSVIAATDFDLDAEPDEGAAAEVAAAQDAFYKAQKQAKRAEIEAENASKDAEEKLKKLHAAAMTQADEETIRRLNTDAMEAKDAAIKAARRAVKRTVKAKNFADDLNKMGVNIHEDDSETL
jgi:amino acid transporter